MVTFPALANVTCRPGDIGPVYACAVSLASKVGVLASLSCITCTLIPNFPIDNNWKVTCVAELLKTCVWGECELTFFGKEGVPTRVARVPVGS